MDQNFYSVKWMSDSISQKIKDKFLKKNVKSDISNSCKGISYIIFKTTFVCKKKKYLNTLSRKLRIFL